MRPLSLSVKGEKSENNEDALLIMANKGLFVVADGVGGGPSGDFASRTLVDAIYRMAAGNGPLNAEMLQHAIQSANKLVFDAAQDPNLNGMASTVACALVNGDELLTMHVGDSRVYVLNENTLTQLTQDHTKSVKKSDDTIKNVVTNAVGLRSEVRIEVQEHRFVPGDELILVTDGITDVISDQLMFEILTQTEKGVVDRLSQLMVASEEMGGRDDKTIIFCLNR